MAESEAIELFKERLTFIKEHYAGEVKDYEEALEIGIQTLEKQTSKKPDFTEDKEFALCPCCNGKGLLNKQKYCDNCGQKIAFDWGDEE